MGAVQVEPPEARADGVTVELVAAEPDIVTPTGIAVDAKGRVFVIENQTHQRDKRPGYDGPPTDRVKIFDGGKSTVFAEGFTNGMSLRFGPGGRLYLATRSQIFVFEGSTPKLIIDLKTKGNYPHNGVAGLVFGPKGRLHFSLGENLGADYTFVGADGRKISGGGEGGSMYRCNPDGSGLERIATGVWNCFSMEFVGDQLFAGDDDPDSSPPCRLLHVVEGADFGFRFRLGRDGTHPFQSWHGRLPGTLPKVAGLLQAPTGMVWHRGRLWIGSWSGHAIRAWTLTPQGASFTAKPETVIQGGGEFRPSGMALGPDGSLYVSDWVKQDYPVHGHGRIWRIRFRDSAKEMPPPRPAAVPGPKTPEAFTALLVSEDPYRRHVAIRALSRDGTDAIRDALAASDRPEARVGVLLALKARGRTEAIPGFLKDPDPGVRQAAFQWIGEAQLKEYAAPMRESIAKLGADEALFTTYMASRELLERGSAGGGRFWTRAKHWEPYLVEAIVDEKVSLAARALALRMLRPDHSELTHDRLVAMMKVDGLRKEALRTLALRVDDASQAELRRLAADGTLPAILRAEAIIGLSRPAKPAEETVRLLESLSSDPAVRHAAERALARESGAPAGPMDPKIREALAQAAMTGGDPEAGELVFYHPRGPRCYTCHTIRGRGGHFGPNLSRVGGGTPRAKIIESILEPSREIAPLFVGLTFKDEQGNVISGRIVEETPDLARVITADGQFKTLRGYAKVRKRVSRISLMPENLVAGLTTREFRDLVAFLASLK